MSCKNEKMPTLADEIRAGILEYPRRESNPDWRFRKP